MTNDGFWNWDTAALADYLFKLPLCKMIPNEPEPQNYLTWGAVCIFSDNTTNDKWNDGDVAKLVKKRDINGFLSYELYARGIGYDYCLIGTDTDDATHIAKLRDWTKRCIYCWAATPALFVDWGRFCDTMQAQIKAEKK